MAEDSELDCSPQELSLDGKSEFKQKTSKSCTPSLLKPGMQATPVVHRKLPPPDGGHLGRGIWRRLPRFPPSPVNLCMHLHYSADPPEKNLNNLCGGESAKPN